MRERLSTASEGLPDDVRAVFEGCAQRGDWGGALAVLLTEAERRSDVRERVSCYLSAAALYEEQFANAAEAQRVLEYVLRLSPGESAAIVRLREIYTRARYREKLRWLAEDPGRIAAQATVPRLKAFQVAASAGSPGGGAEGVSGLTSKVVAAGMFIALPASVIAANRHANALVEPHDNAGGILDWLLFVSLDLAFCVAFIALVWLPMRWALRHAGGSTLLMMLALLAATFLIALVPTLGWNVIDATNVLEDPNAPRSVTVRVVDQARSGKSITRFSVVEEQGSDRGSTKLIRSLGLKPVGSEHVLRRGEGFFGRPYYLPAK